MLHQPQPQRPVTLSTLTPPHLPSPPPSSLPASLRIGGPPAPRPSNPSNRNRASYVPARTLTQRAARIRESLPPPGRGGYIAFHPGARLEEEQKRQEEVLRDVEALLALAVPERPKSAAVGTVPAIHVAVPRSPSAEEPMSPALYAKIRRALSFRVEEAENEDDEGYTDDFADVSSELMAGKYQNLIGSLS